MTPLLVYLGGIPPDSQTKGDASPHLPEAEPLLLARPKTRPLLIYLRWNPLLLARPRNTSLLARQCQTRADTAHCRLAKMNLPPSQTNEDLSLHRTRRQARADKVHRRLANTDIPLSQTRQARANNGHRCLAKTDLPPRQARADKAHHRLAKTDLPPSQTKEDFSPHWTLHQARADKARYLTKTDLPLKCSTKGTDCGHPQPQPRGLTVVTLNHNKGYLWYGIRQKEHNTNSN